MLTSAAILPIALLICSVRASAADAEGRLSSCRTGFSEDVYAAFVSRSVLEGQSFLKVKFDDCAGNQGIQLESSDPDFKVGTDGTLYAAHSMQIPSKQVKFAVTAQDARAQEKWETVVKLLVKAQGNSMHNIQKNGRKNMPPESEQHLDDTLFPWRQQQSSNGLKRQKRDWVIPPINVPENSRGPFPLQLVRIYENSEGCWSNNDAEYASEMMKNWTVIQ